jgi:hypothetical protein
VSDDYRDDPWVEAITSLPRVVPDTERTAAVRRRCRTVLAAGSSAARPRGARAHEPDARIWYSFGGSAPSKYFTK